MARAGHVTRAAAALRLSQSATGTALAEIEQRLGAATPASVLARLADVQAIVRAWAGRKGQPTAVCLDSVGAAAKFARPPDA